VNIILRELQVVTTESQEQIVFSPNVTFIHGPIGTGKSTTAQLVDFCLGGRLDQTPAVQTTFIAASLAAQIRDLDVVFERSATERGHVRVTWKGPTTSGAVSAPVDPGDAPILGDTVFNLSDLIFTLAGIEPIRVRRSKRDPESPLVRLSFRDLMWYCYLKQDKLDSSFYRLEDGPKRWKSMDAMRFIAGLHSERLNELDAQLADAQDEQRGKRAAVEEIRRFLGQFDLASPLEVQARIEAAKSELAAVNLRKGTLESGYATVTHTAEPMREELRRLSDRIASERVALDDLSARIAQQRSLRSELIAAKVKAARAESASSVLAGVEFERCPRCGTAVSGRIVPEGVCCLCMAPVQDVARPADEIQALRRDVDSRIDDLSDSVRRHQRELNRGDKRLADLIREKGHLDASLSAELKRYDSAFVANVRSEERKSAALQERVASLEKLVEMPASIDRLEKEAGEIQGRIDNLRSEMAFERSRLTAADKNIRAVGQRFFDVMRAVGFPGVEQDDAVQVNTRDWLPYVIHGDIEWSFYGAGSGGKKTLFNVCYALAVHEVALEAGLPLPNFLVIDSPTKNISRDINRKIVGSLYRYIYELAERTAEKGQSLQFILIDSELVPPHVSGIEFAERLMSDSDPEHPPLFSRYKGP
jgi:uncharacterized protein YydD (DUF2326 family)